MSGEYRGYGPSSGHGGYDIYGLTLNEPVFAAHSGYALLPTGALSCTPNSVGGGKQVIIEHGGGTAGSGSVYPRYHHLSQVVIPHESWVAAGDLIGYQGNTGHIGTCLQHLHLEFRKMPVGSGVYLDYSDIQVDYSITAGSPIGFQGRWFFNSSADSVSDRFVYFGDRGDVPVVGDWDGDGFDTVGFVRIDPATGYYWWFLSNTPIRAASWGQIMTVHHGPFYWGLRGDKIVTGDWNGDGVDTPGIVRDDHPGQNNTVASLWLTNNVTAGAVHTIEPWGNWPGRVPVSGDWNSDGVDSPGIVWLYNTGWYLTNDVHGSPALHYQFTWGQPTDIFMAGDWQQANADRPIVLQK